jgi:hypothetical protein
VIRCFGLTTTPTAKPLSSALAQRRSNSIAAHRALGNGRDMRLQAGASASSSMAFGRSGIHVGQTSCAATPRLHDNVDQIARAARRRFFDAAMSLLFRRNVDRHFVEQPARRTGRGTARAPSTMVDRARLAGLQMSVHGTCR